jgi:DNA-directed RNA polymerase specialized sigma subunit
LTRIYNFPLRQAGVETVDPEQGVYAVEGDSAQGGRIIDPGVDVYEQVVTSLEAARVRRAVKQLPGLERLVIRLLYGVEREDALTAEQVASRLNVSVAEVYRCRQRALNLLHEELREEYGIAPAA